MTFKNGAKLQKVQLAMLDQDVQDKFTGYDSSLTQKTTQLNSVYNNQTVANMKTNSNVSAGNVIKTFGFYSFGDGGGAEYLVVSNTGKIGNDITLFDLPNNLQAQLIHNGSIKAEQIGCKKDTNYDNTPNVVKGIGANIKDFYFQAGNYQFNELIISYDTATDGVTYNLGCNVRLHGATKLTYNLNGYRSTVFSPYQTGQRFIVKFGGKADFSIPASAVATDVDNIGCIDIGFDDSGKPTTKGCLALEYVYSSQFSLAFFNNQGASIYMKNVWELDFEKLIVRENSYTGAAVFIDDALNDGTSNTSTLTFQKIDLEGISGTFLKTTIGSNAGNIMIGTISYEHNFTHAYTTVASPIPDLTTFNSLTKIPLFELGHIDGLTIDQMNLAGLSKRSFTDGTTNYTDSIFRLNEFFNISVSNININDGGAFVQLTDGAGLEFSMLKVGAITSSYRNRLYFGSGTTTDLLLLSTVTNGGVIIDNNSFKEKDDIPYAIAGKMYAKEELLKLCNGTKTSYTLAYDSLSINSYVFKRINTDFQTIANLQITNHLTGRIRLRTNSTTLQIQTQDTNGNIISNQNIGLTGSSSSYLDIDFNVKKDPGVVTFRLIIPSDGTTCYVDYLYLRPIPAVQSASSPAITNGQSITTSGFTLTRVNPTSAVTGVILQAGVYGGQEVIVLNESANSITFAASGSNVSGGSSVVINGNQASRFVWDSGTNLWYKIS